MASSPQSSPALTIPKSKLPGTTAKSNSEKYGHQRKLKIVDENYKHRSNSNDVHTLPAPQKLSTTVSKNFTSNYLKICP